jgi:RNA polymerase sigma-70 factor (ECF subfamily)
MTDAARAELEQRLAALLTANGAALGRLAASYAACTSDRDDLLQEISVALWQALPRFRGECSERTFLFRIAHNRCIAHLAKRRAVVALDGSEVELPDPAPNAESALSQQQESERLLAVIRQLPLNYRQVIVLTLEGLDYREIAQVLGIGESNVGVRLNRARHLLRERLTKGDER